MGQTLKLKPFVTFCCIAAICVSAHALDPSHRITQYGHTAWRVQDGVFAGAPTAITQTSDGYLWIGTQSGLVRFDGVRFVPLIPPDNRRLSRITSLLGARDGSLWIGTAVGLLQWNNGRLIPFYETAGNINSIFEDREGSIWVARSRNNAGGLCQVARAKVACYGPKDGLVPYAVQAIPDVLGNLWVAGITTLVRWKLGSSTAYNPSGLASSNLLHGIADLAIDPDGSIWVGMSRGGHGLGLQRLVQGSWKAFVTSTFDSSTLNVSSLWLDRENALWIGTEGSGLYRIRGSEVDRFRSADGLSSDAVEKVYEDKEGNLWVVTSEGIDRFRDMQVVNYSTHEGLSGDGVASVLASRDGTVWLGNETGLDLVRGKNISTIGPKQGLPGKAITALFEDHAGRLWIGIDNGLFVYEHGKFILIRRRNGKATEAILAMTEDVDGNVWVQTVPQPASLLCIRGRTVLKEIPTSQVPHVFALAADPQNGIWLGLAHGGLARYRKGHLETFPDKPSPKLQVSQLLVNSSDSVLAATTEGLFEWRKGNVYTLTVRNGLPCNFLYAVVSDRQGNLWLNAECGLLRIGEDQLERWRKQPEANIKVDILDAFDGAQPGVASFQPYASRSSDGRLWFANEKIAQVIDPEHLVRNAIAPPVHVEDVIADRKSYPVRDGLALPPRTRDIEIDYTALSFVVPQKVKFRYKLEGRDQDWQDPQTRRQAFYNDLPPRKYHFRVIACNNDGVWNQVGATLDFSIAPAFYQTGWFKGISIAAGLCVLYLFYFLRLKRVTRQVQVRMKERFNERERIARDLHDTLLQSVQGLILKVHAAAKEIRKGEPARENLEKTLDYADQVVAEGRDRVRSLRGTSESLSDLPMAFNQVAEEDAPGHAASLKVVVEGIVRELHPMVLEESFSIGREALINALRHSGGLHVEVEIAYDQKQFRLRVRDDGSGIDPSVLEQGGRPDHWGLPGMRERAQRIGAQLQLWSRPETGTEVELTVPGTSAYRSIRTKPRRFWFGRLSRIDM